MGLFTQRTPRARRTGREFRNSDFGIRKSEIISRRVAETLSGLFSISSSDRGVRFGIFHAKYAKDAKELIFLETLVTLPTVA